VTGFTGLFDTKRVTTFYSSLLHTSFQSRLHCRCLVSASNGGRSPSSGYPNCPRPQLPASNSNSSQGLNRSSPLTNSLQSLPGWRSSHTNLLLFSLPFQDSLVIAAAPRHIASARTAYNSIFRVEKSASEEAASAGGCRP
jgi:hypothetical protein